MMRILLLPALLLVITLPGCRQSDHGKPGEVIVFHAGSLSVPFNQIRNEYEKVNPGVKILLEPDGSLVCARKITELKKPCDIIASSDYFVINELLIPDYAKWSIKFATNEIVIAYNEKSRYSELIDSNNWPDILLRDDVFYCRSDPNSDPCGYRTVFSLMLAEEYYKRPHLAQDLLAKNRDYIRPKEVDLIALIESNAADYMFQYKSVAIQHKLKYVELPDQINLSDPDMADHYRKVSMEVTGQVPGSSVKMTGDYINYSISLINSSPNRPEALRFLSFILSDRGQEIFLRNGQDPVIPYTTEQPDMLPGELIRSVNIVKEEKNK